MSNGRHTPPRRIACRHYDQCLTCAAIDDALDLGCEECASYERQLFSHDQGLTDAARCLRMLEIAFNPDLILSDDA